MVSRSTILKTIGLAGVSALAMSAVAAEARGERDGYDEGRSSSSSSSRRVDVVPYLEVSQIVTADLAGGSGEVLTYSVLAAGVDAGIVTRGAEAQVNLRYERRIDWGDDIGDEDVLSGIARARIDVVPGALSFEAGGLAARNRIDLRGDAPGNLVGGSDNVTQVYSVYAGPTLATHVGDLSVNAAYRLGYTRVEDNNIVLGPGQQPIDVFDDSVSHSVSASVGQQPGPLPFGWSVSGGYAREDAGQLDQRFEEKYARADVTVPVTRDLALVGGIGYEDVEISERDALRDVNGDPVIGNDGRLVTDPASPRLLSFDADGLIWDVGVLWRPSRRTSLEARIGKRYDSTTYYGSFSYQPSSRTAINISAYDAVAGFGSRLNDSLATLPTQFDSFRNPLTGDLNTCVFGAANGLCFNDALQSLASSSFRTRGITGSITTSTGAWQHGLAVGYNRRRFYAANTGALAGFGGVVDQSWFASYFAGTQIDARSSFDANVYASYLDSGIGNGSDVLSLGANAAYYRNFTNRLSGSLAVGVDSYDQQGIDTQVVGSALVGLRYSFQ